MSEVMTQTEALIAIAERNGGRITPSEVIEEARDPVSVLHGAFTWDDTEAADKWRTWEAQKLIRRCRVTVVNEGEKVVSFAFIGLSTDRDDDASNNPYRLARDVSKSEDLMAVATRDALDQLKSVKSRYDHIRSLDSVWKAIDAAAV